MVFRLFVVASKTFRRSFSKTLLLLKRISSKLQSSCMSVLRQLGKDDGAASLPGGNHPKFAKMEELLLDHFSEFERQTVDMPGAATSTRCMVFVQWRDSVEEVVAALEKHRPNIRAHGFVGQSKSKNKGGLSQKQQTEVIQGFKTNTYNVLVSTSIGEEGLDIGEVDLIICFDSQGSAIRQIQRSGRTGRKRDGRCVMLLQAGKEENTYKRSLTNKRSIFRTLTGEHRSKFRFVGGVPTMLPLGFSTPVCEYRDLSTEDPARTSQNTADTALAPVVERGTDAPAIHLPVSVRPQSASSFCASASTKDITARFFLEHGAGAVMTNVDRVRHGALTAIMIDVGRQAAIAQHRKTSIVQMEASAPRTLPSMVNVDNSSTSVLAAASTDDKNKPTQHASHKAPSALPRVVNLDVNARSVNAAASIDDKNNAPHHEDRNIPHIEDSAYGFDIDGIPISASVVDVFEKYSLDWLLPLPNLSKPRNFRGSSTPTTTDRHAGGSRLYFDPLLDRQSPLHAPPTQISLTETPWKNLSQVDQAIPLRVPPTPQTTDIMNNPRLQRKHLGFTEQPDRLSRPEQPVTTELRPDIASVSLRTTHTAIQQPDMSSLCTLNTTHRALLQPDTPSLPALEANKTQRSVTPNVPPLEEVYAHRQTLSDDFPVPMRYDLPFHPSIPAENSVVEHSIVEPVPDESERVSKRSAQSIPAADVALDTSQFSLSFHTEENESSEFTRLRRTSGGKKRQRTKNASSENHARRTPTTQQRRARARARFAASDVEVSSDVEISSDEGISAEYDSQESFVVGDSVIEYDSTPERVPFKASVRTDDRKRRRRYADSAQNASRDSGDYAIYARSMVDTPARRRSRHRLGHVVDHVERLCEAYGSPESASDSDTDNELCVAIVDSAEARSRISLVRELRQAAENHTSKTEFVVVVGSLSARPSLSYVSLCFGSSIGVLHLTSAELAGSLGDPRGTLQSRLHLLCSNFIAPVVLIEMESGPPPISLVSTLAANFSELTVLWSVSPQQSVKQLLAIVDSDARRLCSVFSFSELVRLAGLQMHGHAAIPITKLEQELSFGLSEDSDLKRKVEFVRRCCHRITVPAALALLGQFGTVRGITKADIEDLTECIGRRDVAALLWDALHDNS